MCATEYPENICLTIPHSLLFSACFV